MKRILFILSLLLAGQGVWGATITGQNFTSTGLGTGLWTDPTSWTPSFPSDIIGSNNNFILNHSVNFTGWNPSIGVKVTINSAAAEFKTTGAFTNTNVAFSCNQSGKITIGGDLTAKWLYFENAAANITPSVTATGIITLTNIFNFTGSPVNPTFNISCTDLIVSNYNFYNATYQYYPLTTNVTPTGNVSITNLYSAGSLTINKPSGSSNLTVSNIYSDATKDFTCSVDGNITVSNTFETKKSSTFTTGGTMTLSSAGPSNTASTTNLTVNGNLTLASGLNNNTTGSITVNNGNLNIQSDVNSGKIQNATLNVNTGNFLMQNGATYYEFAIDNSPGTLNVSGGNIDIGNLKMSNNNSTVSVTGNLTTRNASGISKNGTASSLTVGGNVSTAFFTQNSNTATTTISGNLAVSGSLNPLSGSITVGGNLTFGQDLYCNNSTTVTVGGNVSTSNTGNGSLNLNSSDKLIIGGTFTTGTGNFSFVNNGKVQTGGALTINNINSGTNNSSGTIITGGDFTLKDTDGGGNPMFRNDGALTVHGKITADHVELNSSNGSAMVTIYSPAATTLFEINSGLIIPKVSAHMPVSLISFTATALSSDVQIAWITASELNSKLFVVEKSNNGIDFTAIAQLDAAGTSIIKHNYEKIDTKPSVGVNYYRLRQIDIDGTETVSKVESVLFLGTRSTDMTLAPSVIAAGESFQCLFSQSITAEIEVISVLGAVLDSYHVNNAQLVTIETKNLSVGTYFVRLNTGTVGQFVVTAGK